MYTYMCMCIHVYMHVYMYMYIYMYNIHVVVATLGYCLGCLALQGASGPLSLWPGGAQLWWLS